MRLQQCIFEGKELIRDKTTSKKSKIFIAVGLFFVVVLGTFGLWQFGVHRSLSEKPISCGGDWTFGVKCPTGSYCGFQDVDIGLLGGGTCKILPLFPLDFVKTLVKTTLQDLRMRKINSFQDPTFEVEIDMMIGGGFVGATNVYLINFKGEVYGIFSPHVGVPQIKSLIKRVDQQLIKSLRDALLEANIFGMEEGSPKYSGKSLKVIISGKKKTVYFVGTPKNLLKVGGILEEILEQRFVEEIDNEQKATKASPEPLSGFSWILIFQNSGLPPNDNFVEGFYAYDMLTKYYKYPKNRIRFISTLNKNSDKWLELGGIEVFDAYNSQRIISAEKDIFTQPTKQSYIEGLKWLKEKSTSLDDIMIFSFTHGGSSQKGVNFDTDEEFDKDDEFFILGDKNTGRVENFYDGEFADLVAKIRAKNMFIWISACHGGGFAWDITDRVRKSGNVENLYFMTQAIDERDVVLVSVPSTNSPIVKFDWPDFKDNFFGFLINGLTGLREARENGNLVLKVDPPENRSINFALQEIKDCKIDVLNFPATIGILNFTEGSKFPMKPAFGCQWNDASKTREYPKGEATLGYINQESMDFVFNVGPR